MARWKGALVACAVCASGCASAPVVSMSSAPPDPGEYRIGKEDVLEVVVYREPELSRVVPVRPDGFISLPLAGLVEAAGKTPSELEKGLGKVLSPYVHDASVSVLVREVNASKVFVLGEVVRPGGLPLRGPMTVVQAIALAGGRTAYAGDRVSWIRQQRDGKTERATVSFKQLVKGEAAGELWLKNGDVLYVP